MSNPYNNPYVFSSLFRIKAMDITMVVMEEVLAMEVLHLNMEEVAITMIHINQVIMDMEDTKEVIEIRQVKTLETVVHVLVQLVVLAVYYRYVCVDVVNLFLQLVRQKITIECRFCFFEK